MHIDKDVSISIKHEYSLSHHIKGFCVDVATALSQSLYPRHGGVVCLEQLGYTVPRPGPYGHFMGPNPGAMEERGQMINQMTCLQNGQT